MSQVSSGKSERVPRAQLLLSRVLVLCFGRFEVRWVRDGSIGSGLNQSIDPLHGVPCFPFYRPRKSTGYNGGKEKNEREAKAFRIARSFLSFIRVPLTL